MSVPARQVACCLLFVEGKHIKDQGKAAFSLLQIDFITVRANHQLEWNVN